MISFQLVDVLTKLRPSKVSFIQPVLGIFGLPTALEQLADPERIRGRAAVQI